MRKSHKLQTLASGREASFENQRFSTRKLRLSIEMKEKRSISPVSTPSRPIAQVDVKGGTGISYDERMMLHRHEWSPEEQECPARLSRPFSRIQHYGLMERCILVPARNITESALLSVHSKEYVSLVKKSAKLTTEQLYDLSGQYDGVFFNSFTWEASSLAAGTVLRMASLVASGKLMNGLALVRPPGHHAMYNEACGYCFFNNVAIAAAHLLGSPPMSTFCPNPSEVAVPPPKTPTFPQFKRILIVDWDVHQGQGTQFAFYNDNRVLFISIHRYERQKFWPKLREGDFDFIGDGAGRGFNINVPLNKTGMTDCDFLAIFHTIIMPVAYEFDPEIVFVSCGFDAAVGNAEGKMWISPACYGHMTHHLRTLAGGKIVVVLEGGYFLDSLEEGCVHVLKSLLGDAVPPLQAQGPPSRSVRRTLSSSIVALRQYWRCLNIPGLSGTVLRPDLSRFPQNSWPLVKGVIWPDINPKLPKPLIAFSRRLLQKCFPAPLPKSTLADLLVLLQVDASSQRNYPGPSSALRMKRSNNDVYRTLQLCANTFPVPSQSNYSKPQKTPRFSAYGTNLEGAAQTLEGALTSLFKNEHSCFLVSLFSLFCNA
uniref:Hist_deacetyl domain-containing protein n=1 Tax=Mesocestoides corti TaxID=53468 RepID=A0A5K3F7I6_MESCO